MFNLIPSVYLRSTYDIDFQTLYDRGFRGILFDIDNTLVGHNAPQNERSMELLKRLEDMGFKCGIVSNNGMREYRPSRIPPVCTMPIRPGNLWEKDTGK